MTNLEKLNRIAEEENLGEWINFIVFAISELNGLTEKELEDWLKQETEN